MLTTLFELLARAGKWDEALPLVDEMQAQRLLDDAQAKHKKGVLHHMLATAAARSRTGPTDALAQARRAAKAAPGFAPGVGPGGRAGAAGRTAAGWRCSCSRRAGAPSRIPTSPAPTPSSTPARPPSQRQKRIDTRLAPR